MGQFADVAGAKVVVESVRQFASRNRKAAIYTGVVIGGMVGFGIMASKLGIVTSVAIGVLAGTTVGIAVGKRAAEAMVALKEPDYIPPVN